MTTDGSRQAQGEGTAWQLKREVNLTQGLTNYWTFENEHEQIALSLYGGTPQQRQRYLDYLNALEARAAAGDAAEQERDRLCEWRHDFIEEMSQRVEDHRNFRQKMFEEKWATEARAEAAERREAELRRALEAQQHSVELDAEAYRQHDNGWPANPTFGKFGHDVQVAARKEAEDLRLKALGIKDWKHDEPNDVSPYHWVVERRALDATAAQQEEAKCALCGINLLDSVRRMEQDRGHVGVGRSGLREHCGL